MEIAAETVNIGSFTTWLTRRFMATLHSTYAWTSLNPHFADRKSIMREVAARAATVESVADSMTIHSPASSSRFYRAFHSVDAHFAVALRGMRIAGGK